jgi:hypothetical protein
MRLIEEILFGLVGLLYFKLKYKDKKIMRVERDKNFAGTYSNVGRVFLLDGCAIIGAILTIIAIIIVLFKALLDLFL